MDEEGMKSRTKNFALRVIKLALALPNYNEGIVIKNQIIRCGTSVGANYRAACRARSIADFIAKLNIVLEEADECSFWIEIIIERGLIRKEIVEPLLKESNELVAILVSSIKTAKNNK